MADLNREADSSHVHYHGRSPRLALCRFLSTSGGCTPRATRAMARGSAQKIAEEAQKIAEEE